ncbi:hypothetical protein TNIN_448791 [Trichonephila inaurata madagascariensis]|uniref:Uncharacterized protein n=1 Tax=Trichonephila inaurata madagascariensis TaxID=2747483 RepID=A0A8X7C8W8_9ARAC|nr:hypothetical protein TNIN_448791 [Trichonephila inaurata madagascariensis]
MMSQDRKTHTFHEDGSNTQRKNKQLEENRLPTMLTVSNTFTLLSAPTLQFTSHKSLQPCHLFENVLSSTHNCNLFTP